MVSKKYKTEKLNTQNLNLFNKKTGELSEFENLKLTKIVYENKYRVSSKNYVTLDLDSILNTSKNSIPNLNKLKLHLGLLFIISPYISFHNCVLIDKNNIPFTAKTIALELGLKQRTVKESLNSLAALGIIYNGILKTSVYNNKKIICVNPTIIRRGKDFLPELFTIFKNFAYDNVTENYGKNDSLYKYRGE